MTIVRAAAVAACLLGGPGSQAAWAGSYIFRNAAFPGAAHTDLYGLNDGGEVVGIFSDVLGNRHGFSLIDGRYTQIDVTGGVDTNLTDINRTGLAVGSFRTPGDVHRRLFTYDTRTGVVTSTLPPAGLSFGGASINAAGVITGVVLTDRGEELTFLKTTDGVRIIGRPPGSTFGYYPLAINDRAVVVGDNYRGDGTTGSFIFHAGVSTVLNIPGFTDTTLTFITDSGITGGAVVDAKLNQHGFTMAGGKVTFIAYPGSDANNVAGVTAAGDVIGQWFVGATSKGYVLTGGVYHNLQIPYAPAWSVYIGKVNASGSMIGSALNPAVTRLVSFIAICRRDQVPCTQ